MVRFVPLLVRVLLLWVERGQRDGLLAALLDVGPHEVLGVLLEHVVDLVEDGVHVLAELLTALLTGRGCVAAVVVVPAAATLTLGLLLRHRLPPHRADPRPIGADRCRWEQHYPADPRHARCLGRCGGRVGIRPGPLNRGSGPRRGPPPCSNCRSARRRAGGSRATAPGSGSGPATRVPGRRSPSPRTRRPPRSGTAPGSARGNRRGCPPAGCAWRRARPPRPPAASSSRARPAGCTDPCPSGRRCTAGPPGPAGPSSRPARRAPGSPPAAAAWPASPAGRRTPGGRGPARRASRPTASAPRRWPRRRRPPSCSR